MAVWRASIGFGTAWVLAASLFGGFPAEAAGGTSPAAPVGLPAKPVVPVTEAADPVAAAVGARSSGQRVEVLSLRTQMSRTWVNPDGTWTTEDAAGPVRFVDAVSGEWRDVDLSLVAGPGGVAAVAHPLGLTFAGGSQVSAPLRSEVSVDVGGTAVGAVVPVVESVAVSEPSGEGVVVGWPGVLPAPVLSGSTATYADVTPGVDLRVQALTTGWESFFVVDAPPVSGVALSWTLPLDLTGVTAREEVDGSIAFVSTSGSNIGEVVSVMPAAFAWDAQRLQKYQAGRASAARIAYGQWLAWSVQLRYYISAGLV